MISQGRISTEKSHELAAAFTKQANENVCCVLSSWKQLSNHAENLIKITLADLEIPPII